MKRLINSLGLLAAALVLSSRPASAASLLNIQFTGLHLVYNGFDIFDAGSQLGGNQNPAESDPLNSVLFVVDCTLVGSLSSDIYADLAIVDVAAIPVGGGAVTSTFGGFFDLLTSRLGCGLGLDIESFRVYYTGGQLAIRGTTSIAGQMLPFGLLIGTPVEVSFTTTNLASVTNNGRFLTGFTGAGAGEIGAQVVPEPTSVLLVSTGFALLGRRALRRRC